MHENDIFGHNRNGGFQKTDTFCDVVAGEVQVGEVDVGLDGFTIFFEGVEVEFFGVVGASEFCVTQTDVVVDGNVVREFFAKFEKFFRGVFVVRFFEEI